MGNLTSAITGASIDSSGFSVGLSPTEDTIQKAFDVLDVRFTKLTIGALSSAGTIQESNPITITISPYDATSTYIFSMTGGHGSIVDNSNGTYTVTAPAFNVAPANTLQFNIKRTKELYVDSLEVSESVTVTEAPAATADVAVTDLLTVSTVLDGYDEIA